MSSFRIRPVFTQTIPLGMTEVQDRITQAVERDGDGRFEVKRFPCFLCLRIREADRHFWSPRLNMSLESTPEGHTRINGIYGPNASVWGLFLYGYMAIGMSGLFSAALGFAQCAMGKHPWGLWLLGLMIALAITLYLIAQFGQKLGAQQMFMLHQAYEAAVGTMVEVH